MKPIKQLLPRILTGFILTSFLLLSYSCTQESVLDSEETLNAVYAKADKGKRVKKSWKINSSGTFAPDFSMAAECGGLLPLKIEGSGNASHIGLFDVVILWCTGGIGGPANFITGTLYTANGDLIYFESVEFRPFEIDYIVTGGTGRFDGAEGAFTLTQTEFNIESPDGAPPSGTYTNEGGGHIIY